MAKTRVMSAYEKTIFAHVNSAAMQAGTLRGSLSVMGRILDAVKAMLAELKENLTPEIKAEIKLAAASVFDTMVVLPEPLDAMSDFFFKKALDFILGA